MIVGGYSLDLYCDEVGCKDHERNWPVNFYGQTYSECARLARKAGWDISRKDNIATCPACRKRKANQSSPSTTGRPGSA